MENAKTYVLSRLQQLVDTIPELKVMYKYDGNEQDHLVKVLPFSEFEDNSTFHDLESEILFDFIEKYPHDNLVFISEGECIDMLHADEVLVGDVYYVEMLKKYLDKETSFQEINFNLFNFQDSNDDLLEIEDGVLGEWIVREINTDKSVILNELQYSLPNQCIVNDYFSKELKVPKGIQFVNLSEDKIVSEVELQNYALAA